MQSRHFEIMYNVCGVDLMNYRLAPFDDPDHCDVCDK